MQASIIVPIIAVISLLVKAVFGIEIGEELQAQIADAFLTASLAVIAVFGVLKAHKNKKLTNLE